MMTSICFIIFIIILLGYYIGYIIPLSGEAGVYSSGIRKTSDSLFFLSLIPFIIYTIFFCVAFNSIKYIRCIIYSLSFITMLICILICLIAKFSFAGAFIGFIGCGGALFMVTPQIFLTGLTLDIIDFNKRKK